MTSVIARAGQEELVTGKQTVAIDITQGKKFWGKRDTEELQNQIIGMKEKNLDGRVLIRDHPGSGQQATGCT